MSEMIELLRSRRSIRKYTAEPVDARARAVLAEALLRAPSSRNRRPWEFVFVDDAQLLERLAQARPHGTSWLRGAALAIVICGDPAQCDVWIEDCSIASFVAHLQAHALGLGSCWAQIRLRARDEACSAEAHVRELLGIPEHLAVLSIIGIGHAAETKPGVPADELPGAKIWANRYGV